MAEKKMPGRFTVQFNMDDPQQREVADFLERQGRRKAQIITNALLHYLSCEKAASVPVSGGVLLESRLLDIIKKALGQECGDTSQPQNTSSQPDDAFPQTPVDYSAIERTMFAFEQQ